VALRLLLADWEQAQQRGPAESARGLLRRAANGRDLYLHAARAELGLPPPAERVLDLT
jgi:hypothetical protein